MENQVDICDLKLCNTCMSCICLLELRCKYYVLPYIRFNDFRVQSLGSIQLYQHLPNLYHAIYEHTLLKHTNSK